MSERRVVGVISGGKMVRPDGSRFWWSDGPSRADVVGEDWEQIGYTNDETARPQAEA